MIVPYESNVVALADEPSSKRSNNKSETKSKKQPAKLRSASSNKQTDMIVPRFGGVSSMQTNDFVGGPNPLAIIENIQKQLMGGGGGMFEINPFEGLTKSMGNPRGMNAEIIGVMGFQNFGQPTSGRGMGGKMISHTYVMKSAMGSDGKPFKEQYFSHNYAARGEDGTMLSEKQQGYQNTSNKVQKIALEKTMDDKGRRMVKERIKGQGEDRTHNIYYGIDETEGDDFERRWNKKSEEIGFIRDFGRPLGYHHYCEKQPMEALQLRNYNSENARAMPVNDYYANKFGLGYGGGGQQEATSKYFNNNIGTETDDRTPRMGRTRTMNNMPTMSSRGVLVGSGMSSLNNIDNRVSFNKNIEPAPKSYSNLEISRNNLARNSGSMMPNYSGMFNNGNFAYKAPQ